MKIFSLVAFSFVCANSMVGFAEDVLPGNPNYDSNSFFPRMTPREQREFVDPPGQKLCADVRTGIKSTVGPREECQSQTYLVPWEQYTDIIAQEYKLDCPKDIDFQSSGSTKPHDPRKVNTDSSQGANKLFYPTTCSYKDTSGNEKLKVSYRVECEVTGQYLPLTLDELSARYGLDLKNLGKCFSVEKKMSYKEIFNVPRAKPASYDDGRRIKGKSGGAKKSAGSSI